VSNWGWCGIYVAGVLVTAFEAGRRGWLSSYPDGFEVVTWTGVFLAWPIELLIGLCCEVRDIGMRYPGKAARPDADKE